MVGMDDRYYICPECGCSISFHYDYDKRKYVSMCPFCRNKLEIDKEEYEDKRESFYPFKTDF